jgi:hypothetical protein
MKQMVVEKREWSNIPLLSEGINITDASGSRKIGNWTKAHLKSEIPKFQIEHASAGGGINQDGPQGQAVQFKISGFRI